MPYEPLICPHGQDVQYCWECSEPCKAHGITFKACALCADQNVTLEGLKGAKGPLFVGDLAGPTSVCEHKLKATSCAYCAAQKVGFFSAEPMKQALKDLKATMEKLPKAHEFKIPGNLKSKDDHLDALGKATAKSLVDDLTKIPIYESKALPLNEAFILNGSGIKKGELATWLAPTSTGKSLFPLHLLKQAQASKGPKISLEADIGWEHLHGYMKTAGVAPVHPSLTKPMPSPLEMFVDMLHKAMGSDYLVEADYDIAHYKLIAVATHQPTGKVEKTEMSWADFKDQGPLISANQVHEALTDAFTLAPAGCGLEWVDEPATECSCEEPLVCKACLGLWANCGHLEGALPCPTHGVDKDTIPPGQVLNDEAKGNVPPAKCVHCGDTGKLYDFPTDADGLCLACNADGCADCFGSGKLCLVCTKPAPCKVHPEEWKVCDLCGGSGKFKGPVADSPPPPYVVTVSTDSIPPEKLQAMKESLNKSGAWKQPFSVSHHATFVPHPEPEETVLEVGPAITTTKQACEDCGGKGDQGGFCHGCGGKGWKYLQTLTEISYLKGSPIPPQIIVGMDAGGKDTWTHQFYVDGKAIDLNTANIEINVGEKAKITSATVDYSLKDLAAAGEKAAPTLDKHLVDKFLQPYVNKDVSLAEVFAKEAQEKVTKAFGLPSEYLGSPPAPSVSPEPAQEPTTVPVSDTVPPPLVPALVPLHPGHPACPPKHKWAPDDLAVITIPWFVKRVGYPKVPKDYVPDLEEILKDTAGNAVGGKVDALQHLLKTLGLHHTDQEHSELKKIKLRLAYLMASKDGFGGTHRSIHWDHYPHAVGWLARVVGVRRVVTGTYNHGSPGGYDYNGEWTGEPTTLEDQVHHTLAKVILLKTYQTYGGKTVFHYSGEPEMEIPVYHLGLPDTGSLLSYVEAPELWGNSGKPKNPTKAKGKKKGWLP